MNSPYNGNFYVSQKYKSGIHDGLDLVGGDSKEIHATQNGIVHYAGWENPANQKQGFGQYVCIRGVDNLFYYYGHMSQIRVKTGQSVKITDVIGIEGSTGYSTGSHCHYEVREGFFKGANVVNINSLSGIPNIEFITYNDGYKQKTTQAKPEFKVGDLVKIKDGGTYYDGAKVPDWVMQDKWYVVYVSGDRVVLGQNKIKTLDIKSPVNAENLELVKAATDNIKALAKILIDKGYDCSDGSKIDDKYISAMFTALCDQYEI